MRRSLIIVFCLAIFSVCDLYSQDRQSRRAQLEKEIARLDKQLKETSSQTATALTRLTLVRDKIKARQKLIEESNKEIAGIGSLITSKQNEINQVSAKLDTMTAYYERLVRSAYKNRDARVWYMYILASDNISQGLRRFSYFRNLSRELNKQAENIQTTRDELEKEKAKLLSLKQEAQKLRSERVAGLQEMKAEEAEAKRITTRLQKEKSAYQKELSSKKREAQALEREVKKAITTTKKSKVAVDYTLSGKFADNKGKLPWPVDGGSIVSRFGKQYHPVFKSLQLPPNNGITVAVSKDATVSAVFDGVVSQISVLPGYHQCVLVQHGKYFTLYSKIKNVYVRQGDKVKTGQKIGVVDTINGETTFHFEIWNEKTTPQNPETWLRAR